MWINLYLGPNVLSSKKKSFIKIFKGMYGCQLGEIVCG